MKTKLYTPKTISVIVLLLATCGLFAQKEVIEPDLFKIPKGDGWEVFNREASLVTVEENRSVHFNEAEGSGGAWIKNLEFENGIIEFDVKGRDLKGKSFVGIAFRGTDNETYDAIYFRPFNFKSDNELNRSHGVQYVSQPKNTWYQLRREHVGEYEKEVKPVPNPKKFFHAKVVIDGQNISVYVNGSEEACLEVKALNDRKKGKIGLWMGHGSDATFSSLKIINK